MKIALGMIIRCLITGKKLMSFIDNAKKYGHELDCVIVAHMQENNKETEQKIREKATLHTVNVRNPSFCRDELKRRGIPEETIRALTDCPVDSKSGLVPYGHNRMMVVMEAILRGADVLIFVDSDVECAVLTKTPDGDVLTEIDFFAEHLKHLNDGAVVTTGEYSGYNILPHASFEGMDDLLYGVKKSNMSQYWKTSSEHRGLTYQPAETVAKPCQKILGGNLAMNLSGLADLPPFFSSSYVSNDELFLCRGEDTVLGFKIAALGIKCMDIGIYPLHDTYSDYPAEPDLQRDKRVQDRLFYACTGWVGRNPFFNYIIGKDPKTTMEFQREHLEKGLRALVRYTSYPRFSRILQCFDDSWGSLDRYIAEFQRASEAWENFKKGVSLK